MRVLMCKFMLLREDLKTKKRIIATVLASGSSDVLTQTIIRLLKGKIPGNLLLFEMLRIKHLISSGPNKTFYVK